MLLMVLAFTSTLELSPAFPEPPHVHGDATPSTAFTTPAHHGELG